MKLLSLLFLVASVNVFAQKTKVKSKMDVLDTEIISVGQCAGNLAEALQDISRALNGTTSYITIEANLKLNVNELVQTYDLVTTKDDSGKTQEKTNVKEFTREGVIKNKSYRQNISLTNMNGEKKSGMAVAAEAALAAKSVELECKNARADYLSIANDNSDF